MTKKLLHLPFLDKIFYLSKLTCCYEFLYSTAEIGQINENIIRVKLYLSALDYRRNKDLLSS